MVQGHDALRRARISRRHPAWGETGQSLRIQFDRARSRFAGP